jgi:hypothetical protein
MWAGRGLASRVIGRSGFAAASIVFHRKKFMLLM